ncbi:MAG TPA: fructose-6-phosphate aldolase, partial [Planctomycetaceae bacterium]|nr:fructose-6-phosphate aldolase [Planctomycetaceae bacterium]
MRIFLDTANLDEIREVAGWGILSGVTTNPTLLSKERGDFRRIIEEICEIVQGPVSVEVIAQDVRGMIEEARRYSSWSPHVVIKIPIVPSGLAAISVLSKEGVRVNTTLIFNPIQALLAALAGAAYVSPYLGRVDDISADGLKL